MALLRTSIALGLVLLGLGLPASAPRAEGVSEYSVKAAFLVNFARLVEWPEQAFAAPEDPVVVCIAGEEAYEYAQQAGLRRQKVGRREVRLRTIDSADEVSACHVVFVSEGSSKLTPRVVGGAADASILTVGEADGFAARGGIINFYREGSKVRFEINPTAAERAGLQISSRLLRLARIVEDDS